MVEVIQLEINIEVEVGLFRVKVVVFFCYGMVGNVGFIQFVICSN